MTDIIVPHCKERDCQKEFVITEAEQAFFLQKGFTNPLRCPSCRSKRKRMRQQDEYRDQGYQTEEARY